MQLGRAQVPRLGQNHGSNQDCRVGRVAFPVDAPSRRPVGNQREVPSAGVDVGNLDGGERYTRLANIP